MRIIVLLILSISGTGWAERHRKRDLRSRGSLVYENSLDRCLYPCTCPTSEICDECQECPRQLGEPCNQDKHCDLQRGLICKYLHGDSEGTCRESTGGVPCIVYNKTYEHGETFSIDCRTQCTCQNGTYGCSSLCPQEHISPKGTCRHPRLVEVPGQCCREWMCDSQAAEEPRPCQPAFSKWSTCSSECGAGLSNRRSNLNARCEPTTETRICQTRRCQDIAPTIHQKNQHHLRRGHECKATHRLSTAVTLKFGPCRSKKRYRPKFCGHCTLPGIVCEPSLSTTVKVDFACEGTRTFEDVSDLLPEYLEPGEDSWTDDRTRYDQTDTTQLTVSVQWVLKCRCETTATSNPTSSTGEVILHRVHRTAAP